MSHTWQVYRNLQITGGSYISPHFDPMLAPSTPPKKGGCMGRMHGKVISRPLLVLYEVDVMHAQNHRSKGILNCYLITGAQYMLTYGRLFCINVIKMLFLTTACWSPGPLYKSFYFSDLVHQTINFTYIFSAVNACVQQETILPRRLIVSTTDI